MTSLKEQRGRYFDTDQLKKLLKSEIYFVLFDDQGVALNWGITQSDRQAWSQALIRGEVPEGFVSLETFQDHLIKKWTSDPKLKQRYQDLQADLEDGRQLRSRLGLIDIDKETSD